MTIYILDHEPKKTAEYLDDKSLDKIIKDIAQILCNVHYETSLTVDFENAPTFPKDFAKNSKWSQWARGCKANYFYLVQLGYAIGKELIHRDLAKKNNYANRMLIDWAANNVPDLPLIGIYESNTQKHYMLNGLHAPFPLVMPKKYQIGLIYKDNEVTIKSYRAYYKVKLNQKMNWYKRGLIQEGIVHLDKNDIEMMLENLQIKWTNRKKPDFLEI